MTLLQPITGIRWIARILALAITGFVVATFAGTGGFNPLRLTAREAALMVPFLLAVAGLVIAWWYEVVGGLLTVDGILLFYAVHWYLTGRFPAGPYFGLIALPGLLFLACGCLEQKHRLVGDAR